jgi:diaminopimelate epimerase
MMGGNGGRCIVSSAADLGVVSGNYPVEFEAPDGLHTAIVERKASQELSDTRIIRLKMRDVEGILAIPEENAFFLNTGTRHLVKFVEGLENYPVKEEGKVLRADPRFAPEGTNVNFVEPEDTPDGVVLHGRTFEKGVEDETLACGTGIVASAIAAYSRGILGKEDPTGRISYGIKAAIAGLSVDFLPEGSGEGFRASDVWLTGPATFVGTVEILL